MTQHEFVRRMYIHARLAGKTWCSGSSHLKKSQIHKGLQRSAPEYPAKMKPMHWSHCKTVAVFFSMSWTRGMDRFCYRLAYLALIGILLQSYIAQGTCLRYWVDITIVDTFTPPVCYRKGKRRLPALKIRSCHRSFTTIKHDGFCPAH